MQVLNINVHVEWKGTTIWEQDIKQDNIYSNDYLYTVAWDISSLAPSGEYDVTISGTGNANGFPGKVLCTNYKMVL